MTETGAKHENQDQEKECEGQRSQNEQENKTTKRQGKRDETKRYKGWRFKTK